MAHDLVALLGPEGVARTADLARKVDRHSIDGWVKARRLLRPYPGVVVLPEAFADWRTRALAAVHATDGVLSHTSALTAWRLAPQGDPVHVSVRAGRRALRRPGLVVHRVQELPPGLLGPYPVTDLARALIDTWGLAAGRDGRRRLVEVARGAVITALREGRVRADELEAETAHRPGLAGRAELRRLVELVRAGSHSELEIWASGRCSRPPGCRGSPGSTGSRCPSPPSTSTPRSRSSGSRSSSTA